MERRGNKLNQETLSLNGKLISKNELLSKVQEDSLFLGRGVFTTLLATYEKIFFFKEHERRLYCHAKAIGIEAPKKLLDLNEIKDLCFNTSLEGLFFRLKAVLLKEGSGYQKIIFLKKLEIPKKKDLSLGVYPYPVSSRLSRIKTLSYLERSLIHEKALESDFDDMISISEEGYILECSYSNLFWVKENHFFLPSYRLPLLKGITSQVMLGIAKKLGFDISFVKMKISELPKEANLFRCNSLIGLEAIRSIKNQNFPLKPELFNLFQNEYEKVREERAYCR